MKKGYLFAGMLAVASLSSCSSDYENGSPDRAGVKLNLNGSIDNSSTRVAADGDGASWEANDSIGVYITNNGSSNFSNTKFVTSAAGTKGSFATADETSIYLLGATPTITAYYPYIADDNLSDEGVYSFDITKDANCDFMFADAGSVR